MKLSRLKPHEKLRGAVRLWIYDQEEENCVPITVKRDAIDFVLHLRKLRYSESSFSDAEDLFIEIGGYVFNAFAKRSGSPIIINVHTLRALPEMVEAFLDGNLPSRFVESR